MLKNINNVPIVLNVLNDPTFCVPPPPPRTQWTYLLSRLYSSTSCYHGLSWSGATYIMPCISLAILPQRTFFKIIRRNSLSSWIKRIVLLYTLILTNYVKMTAAYAWPMAICMLLINCAARGGAEACLVLLSMAAHSSSLRMRSNSRRMAFLRVFCVVATTKTNFPPLIKATALKN